jgi:hypothetical protein
MFVWAENMTVWGACQYVPAGQAVNYLNDRVFQLAKDCGITHLQFWQRNWNESNQITISQAQMKAAVTRMKDFGLKPEICLSTVLSEATSLVQALGSDCKIYEVCKEPHITSGCNCSTASIYASTWNNIVNACRPLASPDTIFGGPAVGVASSSQSWMNTFLANCDADFASYHEFASSQSTIISNVNMYKNLVAQAGKSIPIMITEAQYTSAVESGTADRSINVAFITQYTNMLFDTCKSLNVYGVFLWVLMGYNNNFCMVRPPAQNYAIKPQYTAVKNYIGGVIPPPQHALTVNSTPSGIPFTYTKI